MPPEQSQNQMNQPSSLPPVQAQQVQQAASLPPAALQPAAMPAPGMGTSAAEHQPLIPVSQLKTLIVQYGTNPYTFNAAFQQLKANYLAERYHIVPNSEKN